MKTIKCIEHGDKLTANEIAYIAILSPGRSAVFCKDAWDQIPDSDIKKVGVKIDYELIQIRPIWPDEQYASNNKTPWRYARVRPVCITPETAKLLPKARKALGFKD